MELGRSLTVSTLPASILTVNAGSSSLKLRVLDREDNVLRARESGSVHGEVELRGELESDAPDAGVIAGLMRRLGGMAKAAAADQPEGNLRSRLMELGNLLESGAAEV